MAYRDDHHNNMPFLSKEGLEMERHLKELSDKYGYKKLPTDVSSKQRLFYMEKLPAFWKDEEYEKYEIKLKTHNGSVLATGVSSRGFVCGDYGVFVEIEDSQINRNALKIQPGEEYRVYDPNFVDKVKYQWFTDKDGENIKMYYQQKGVTYADYKPNKWYVSPYEIVVEKVREKKVEKSRLKPANQHISDRPLVVQGDLFGL